MTVMSHSGKPSFGSLNDSSLESDDVDRATGGSTFLTVARKKQPSTRVSLLVEALVRSVVSAYETDRQRVTRTYRKVCRRLYQMGLIDESWSMSELEGVRVQFEHALFQLLERSPIRTPSSYALLQGDFYTSQYKREFDEFEKIGGGAYGKVFRVKHKLDGTEYAVKKIPIHSEGIDSVKSYLSEVKTFASLNHPNIVQYKAAWLELGPPPEAKAAMRLQWDQPQLTIPTKAETDQFLLYGGASTSSFRNCRNEASSTFEIEFEDNTNDCPANDDENSTRGHSLPSTKIARVSSRYSNGMSTPSKVRWATLYIQMALCHGTLDQWLRRRNETINADAAVMPSSAQALKTRAIGQILVQILRGLEYIHSKGVVHHDIKPSNIFVSIEAGDLLVQLGDFGLACPLQRSKHGFARGTPLYASPEQLAGRCDPKSDIYSVGIVLYELLEDFGTDMERTRRISELRSRTDPPIPPDFGLATLVSALVRRRSAERPDAPTLLRALEGVARSDVDTLQERLDEKEREIQRLKALLREHGVQEV